MPGEMNDRGAEREKELGDRRSDRTLKRWYSRYRRGEPRFVTAPFIDTHLKKNMFEQSRFKVFPFDGAFSCLLWYYAIN